MSNPDNIQQPSVFWQSIKAQMGDDPKEIDIINPFLHIIEQSLRVKLTF